MPRAKEYDKYGPYNDLANKYEKMRDDRDHYRGKKHQLGCRLFNFSSSIKLSLFRETG